MSTSQTLSRGLTALEYIATAPSPPSIDNVAERLGVHRSVAYRIVRTLEAHELTDRNGEGACRPALRLATLGRSVATGLRTVAARELVALADATSCTAFLVEREGDEVVTVESREPTDAMVNVVYRPGTRHPIDRGAPGLATLAGAEPLDSERAEVTLARQRGWAESAGEVIPGMASVAAPIPAHDAAIAIVYLAAAERDNAELAGSVLATAASIEHNLSNLTSNGGDR